MKAVLVIFSLFTSLMAAQTTRPVVLSWSASTSAPASLGTQSPPQVQLQDLSPKWDARARWPDQRAWRDRRHRR